MATRKSLEDQQRFNSEALARRLSMLLQGGDSLPIPTGMAGDRVRTRENLSVEVPGNQLNYRAPSIPPELMARFAADQGRSKRQTAMDNRQAAMDFYSQAKAMGLVPTGGNAGFDVKLAPFASRKHALAQLWMQYGGRDNPYLQDHFRSAFKTLF